MAQSQTDPTQLAYTQQGQTSNGYYPALVMPSASAQNAVQYNNSNPPNPFLNGLVGFGERALTMAPALFMHNPALAAGAAMNAIGAGVQGYNAQNQYNTSNAGFQAVKQARMSAAPDYLKPLYHNSNSMDDVLKVDAMNKEYNDAQNAINTPGSNLQYVNGATTPNPNFQTPPPIMPVQSATTPPQPNNNPAPLRGMPNDNNIIPATNIQTGNVSQNEYAQPMLQTPPPTMPQQGIGGMQQALGNTIIPQDQRYTTASSAGYLTNPEFHPELQKQIIENQNAPIVNNLANQLQQQKVIKATANNVPTTVQEMANYYHANGTMSDTAYANWSKYGSDTIAPADFDKIMTSGISEDKNKLEGAINQQKANTEQQWKQNQANVQNTNAATNALKGKAYVDWMNNGGNQPHGYNEYITTDDKGNKTIQRIPIINTPQPFGKSSLPNAPASPQPTQQMFQFLQQHPEKFQSFKQTYPQSVKTYKSGRTFIIIGSKSYEVKP